MPWVAPGGSFIETLKESTRRLAKVDETLVRLAERLTKEGIEYAIIGGMALVAHGYVRYTDDVDVLVTREGLDKIHERLVGRGYVPAFPGARKKLRDTHTGVHVEFITAGEYPGDGKPKPVQFPPPHEASVNRGGYSIIDVPKLIELKLASAMTAKHRESHDMADVESLIATLDLPRELAEQLDPSVRDQYLQKWEAWKNRSPSAPDEEHK